MATYKLTYFNAPGRVEPIRYLFVLAGQEFEDERIDGASWGAMKYKTAFGCLPELTINGEVFMQTPAIARHLSKKFGMMGKDDKESFLVDMIMCCADDVMGALASIRLEKDENRKADLLKTFKEKFKFWLSRLEGMLCKNNGGDGWFVGNAVTPADIFVVHCLSLAKGPCKSEIENHPKLYALCDRFEKIPVIAEWIQKTHH